MSKKLNCLVGIIKEHPKVQNKPYMPNKFVTLKLVKKVVKVLSGLDIWPTYAWPTFVNIMLIIYEHLGGKGLPMFIKIGLLAKI